MEHVLDLLERSYDDFVEAENRLLLDLDLEAKVREDVKVLIRACKNGILGGTYWTSVTPCHYRPLQA
jgi:hypothetical protein